MEVSDNFKDKKGLLTFFGIVLILMGALSLLIFLISVISIAAVQNMALENAQEVSLSSAIVGLMMYLVAAVIFITLGIGSIRAQRWARSLTLLLSWFTFITGILTLILMLFFMQNIFDHIYSATQGNTNVMPVVKAIMYTFLILFLIILPGIFILFYRRESVLKTVNMYDTKERWTDKCPLPLLALSFIFLYTAITPLYYFFYGFVAPFFGTFLIGWPAAILFGVNSVVSIYLAIQIYKLNIKAWYYSLYLYAFWIISFSITLIFNDFLDIYQYMNIPDNQLTLLENSGLFTDTNMILMITLFFIPYMIFFVYTKKYFKLNIVNPVDIKPTPDL